MKPFCGATAGRQGSNSRELEEIEHRDKQELYSSVMALMMHPLLRADIGYMGGLGSGTVIEAADVVLMEDALPSKLGRWKSPKNPECRQYPPGLSGQGLFHPTRHLWFGQYLEAVFADVG